MMINLIIFTNIILALIIFIFNSKIINKINLFDTPNYRKVHTSPVSLIGGLYIFIFYVINFVILSFNYDKNIFFKSYNELVLFSFALSFCFLIGIYDDKYSIKPITKLILLGFVFLIYISIYPHNIINMIEIANFELKFHLKNFSIIFTVLCFLLFLNSSNMIDGIDGLALSYFLICLIYIHFSSEESFLKYFYLPLVTCLILNMKKKIFLGDNGVYILSMVFSVIYIKFYHLNLLTADEIVLLMIVPGIDMLRVFLKRIYTGKSPFSPDQNHLHHIVLKKTNHTFVSLVLTLIIIFAPLIFYKLI